MTKKKETTSKPGYVEYGPLFYDGERYKNPVSVIVNGKKYSIPRGKKVIIPEVVAEILDQSEKQAAYARQVDLKAREEQTVEL